MSWQRDESILARIEKVSALHLRGVSDRAIAASLGVATKTVARDRERGLALVRDRVTADLVDLRAHAAASYLEIAGEAWKGYSSSKSERFLRLAKDVQDSMCKLLGLGQGDQVMLMIEVGRMAVEFDLPPEQLLREAGIR